MTSPDPAQVIPLAVDDTVVVATPTSTGNAAETAAPTEVPVYRLGDTIGVRAGPILDHNGHLVPDGTVVRFIMSTRDEGGGILQQVDATTAAGISRASFLFDKPGKVEISVVSEPAVISGILQFDFVSSGESAVVVTVMVPQPTDTPAPILPTATTVVESDLVTPEGYPRVGVWLLVLLALFGGGVLSYWAMSRIVSTRWGLRWALCIFLGGLLAYNYLALGFPGAAEWIAEESGAFRVLMLTIAGEALGGFIAWVWMQRFSEPGSREG
jgi:beta-N-acetylhexosaminidase